jgi:CheY-like chemotaxis protein
MVFAFNEQGLPMMHSAMGTAIEILLVEDEPNDAYLTMEALKDGKVRNRVSHVGDGEEAMAFLRREGKYASAPRPDLILLDWLMPKKNGLDVLIDIKQDPQLKRIPVVMLTGQKEPPDILKAYNHHVNCYVMKPVDLDQFMGVVRKIEDFWLTVVKLPAAA